MKKKDIFRLRFTRNENISTEAAHSELELLYLLEGTVDIQVEQKLTHMKKEDILVINPDRRRSVSYAKSPLLMHLLIDYSTVREAFQGQDVLFWCDSTGSDHEKYEELRKLLKRLIRGYIRTEQYEKTFSFLADCYEILNYLTFDFVVKAADMQWGEEGDRFEERLFKINNYINSNYDQPISIKDLSEKLYLSIGYLSRFFKKNYGMNFANYLTNVRLVHAADELMYTNTSITRVAYDCGFTSAAIFNKAFKNAYNVTPSEFRKQAEGAEIPEEDLLFRKELDTRIEQFVEQDMAAEDHPEEGESSVRTMQAVYSAENAVPFEHYWNDIINFGDAAILLSSSVREHLSILRKNLNFRYVRFWSLFRKELYIRPDQDSYDFSRIDSILDFVLEQGMKPFIELGMKPRTLHIDIGVGRIEPAEEEYSPEQWQKLMHLFLRHLEKRYGRAALDGWKMELWFDESQRDKEKQWDRYLETFRVTWQEIKSLNDRISLGGYGIRMDSGGEERLRFLKKWKQTTPLPDFVSVMFYGYERGADGMDIHARRSTDDEYFIHALRKEKERLKLAGLDHIPICVSEWNLTPSVRNIINDSVYKGSYVIRNILDVFGEVQSMGFGAGSDRQHSSYDTAGMLFGGTGLITKEGIRKPAAFGIGFLNRLYYGLVGKTKNYLVTTDGYNNFAIICHNQQKLNENYYLTPESKLQKESVWQYFDHKHRLNIRIDIRDLEEGTYKINTYRVNGKFGSILDIWKSTSFEDDLSRDEIQFLNKICEPFIMIRRTETVSGVLMIREELEPNEFMLISARLVR